MLSINYNTCVYLACGVTDMRKSINGLSLLVSEVLEQDIFSNCLFVFCNRNRDKLKILHWDNNGFWLYYKRLEKGRFKWPQLTGDVDSIRLTQRELNWLLDGLNIEKMKAHPTLNYSQNN
jgi:transposase